MTHHAAILGAGMVGSAMAFDLSQDPAFEVTLLDARPEALERARERLGPRIRTRVAELGTGEAVQAAVKGADIVLGALASSLGLQTLRAVIEAGKPYCDISFMADDALSLSPLARDRGVVAVVDCGVGPGMSNVMAGHAVSELSPCESLDICVGGLPLERRWPYEYKAGFAPHDVIEEYTRPSRLVERGQVVVRPALSEPELLEFAGIGTLEAFNSDGLRSLIQTLPVPFMRERTLRYPGHIELMRVFRETGFFSKDEILVNGVRVRPLDVTAALLFPKWTFGPGEPDLTVMRVVALGRRDGQRMRYTYELEDRYDAGTDLRSMSRTTAFPATLMARLMMDGTVATPGVHAPEEFPHIFDTMRAGLEARGITCRLTREALTES